MAYSTGNTNQLQTASLQDSPTYVPVDGLINPSSFKSASPTLALI